MSLLALSMRLTLTATGRVVTTSNIAERGFAHFSCLCDGEDWRSLMQSLWSGLSLQQTGSSFCIALRPVLRCMCHYLRKLLNCFARFRIPIHATSSGQVEVRQRTQRNPGTKACAGYLIAPTCARQTKLPNDAPPTC